MTQQFTSIFVPFAIDAGKGRVAEEDDYAQHVEQMMMQVLFTSPGERVNMPDFGCGVKRLVFAPNSEVSAALAQVTIYQSLNRWLGTAITVNSVTANAIDDRMEISIVYALNTQGTQRYLNIEVTP
jgi:phage baseplate assembly protein W